MRGKLPQGRSLLGNRHRSVLSRDPDQAQSVFLRWGGCLGSGSCPRSQGLLDEVTASERLSAPPSLRSANSQPDVLVHNGDVDLKDRIVINPKVLVGKPVIAGTRISVELIVDLLASGWTHEKILASYPHLSESDIFACLQYAGELLQNERVYPVPIG